MKQKKILVTGGCGYIGGNIVENIRLTHDDTDLTIIDDCERGNNGPNILSLNPPPTIIKKRLECLGQNELYDHKFDIVIHCAANAYVGESQKYPTKYLQRNVDATSKLLESLDLEYLNKFIFSSTCAVYGNSLNKINETSKLNPESPYGWSKAVCESLIESYAKTYNFKSTIFRFFNVAGANKAFSTGERHSPETHLVPLLYQSAKTGKKFKIFGMNYGTKDGTCEREYVHVNDIVEAHELVMSKPQLPNSTVINLCTGKPWSVLELVKRAEKCWGAKINYEYAAERPGDAESLIGDYEKAKLDLGWLPKNSNLDQILNDYHKWIVSNNDT